jgi:signal transduction histidine kinase
LAEGARAARRSRSHALMRYRLAVMVPAAVWLGLELHRAPVELHPSMLQWVVLLAAVELVATEAWGGPGLSVAFAVQVTVAMLFEPVAAGLIAFAGAFDPRVFHGRMRRLHDLSHRSLALSVVAIGSASFHTLAAGVDDGPRRLVVACAVTTTVMYFAFLGAELLDRVLESGRSAREVLHEMNRVSPYRFPLTFPGLGWFSLPAARLAHAEGLWPAVMIFGLAAYGRWVCIKAWTLKSRMQERNELLDAQARELAVHLYREQRTVAELEELSRLKSQLVAMASHEVRTPLTSIIGYAAALRRMPDSVEPGKRHEFLDIIERQAKRILGLAERLLTASRLEGGRFVTALGSVHLRELCHEVVEGLGVDGDRVVIELPRDLPEPVTDRRFLAQVLGNLIENALKYSPRDRLCTIGARSDGEHLIIWVQDYGIGIPDSELRRIFERFYQVDRGETQVAGVGLGLTLVRELVDVLGGTIAVESGLGLGSRFTVTLPLQHPASAQTGRTTNGSRTNIPERAI